MHNELKGCGKSIALWRVIVLIIFLIGGYLMETQGGYLQCIGCIVMIMFGLVILYDSSRDMSLTALILFHIVWGGITVIIFYYNWPKENPSDGCLIMTLFISLNLVVTGYAMIILYRVLPAVKRTLASKDYGLVMAVVMVSFLISRITLEVSYYYAYPHEYEWLGSIKGVFNDTISVIFICGAISYIAAFLNIVPLNRGGRVSRKK